MLCCFRIEYVKMEILTLRGQSTFTKRKDLEYSKDEKIINIFLATISS